ncbi:hypothetical protein [Hyalangium gracile]|uniref:hypothetical protein n=1 Tax=Hyalangium gracile TaxID=394092 RepID=UPI001CCD37A7|nr:hypothetical protein [Hyalangium gracile]
MRRLLNASCLSLVLLGSSSSAAPDAGTQPAASPAPVTPPASGTATDGGVPSATDGGSTIHPSRLAEARALIPPPLLYGQFQPTVGAWVEYEFRSKQATFPVRAAVVGHTLRDNTTPLYQLEVTYDTKPRTLVVLWIEGGTHPLVERLAVSVPPNAPISIPVDLLADQPELRGEQTRARDTEVRGGPFAGKARQLTFRLETGSTMEVVTTPKAPVFGVESLRGPEATWVARKSGTGARPELNAVPIAVPRVPGQ